MEQKGTCPIETGRLYLGRFTMNDVYAVYENWAKDPYVTRFLTWPAHINPDITRQILLEWIESYLKPDFYQWGITRKDDPGTPIGTISAVKIDEETETVSIGYCLGRDWWNQGIMSEALWGVIRFFFEELHLNRVEACHDINNPASGKVMEKCHMTYEGTLRQGGRNNQGIADLAVYSILREEYEALQNMKQEKRLEEQ